MIKLTYFKVITKKLYLVCGKATGETKKEKKLTNNPPKAPKPKAEPGHY